MLENCLKATKKTDQRGRPRSFTSESFGERYNIFLHLTVTLINNCRKTLPELHNNKIVSLSKSHNEQYLLSSDINQSYFWSLEKPSNPYKISHLSEESENEISCCKMSSLSDNLFAFGTITGTLQLSDIRCKKYVYVASPHQKMLAFHSEKPTRKEYFNNMLNRIS